MNSQKRTQKQPKLNNFVCPKSMTLEEWQVALVNRGQVPFMVNRGQVVFPFTIFFLKAMTSFHLFFR